MLKAQYDTLAFTLHVFWAGSKTAHQELGVGWVNLLWRLSSHHSGGRHLTLPGGGAALPDVAAHGHPAGRGDPPTGPGSDHRRGAQLDRHHHGHPQYGGQRCPGRDVPLTAWSWDSSRDGACQQCTRSRQWPHERLTLAFQQIPELWGSIWLRQSGPFP